MTSTAGQLARDTALAAVDAHASAQWKADAKEAVREVALREPYFTSDAIWRWMALNVTGIVTHEHRAMGPIMVWAHRTGVIEPTDRFTSTTKSSQHSQPIRIWRSLTYRGTT